MKEETIVETVIVDGEPRKIYTVIGDGESSGKIPIFPEIKLSEEKEAAVYFLQAIGGFPVYRNRPIDGFIIEKIDWQAAVGLMPCEHCGAAKTVPCSIKEYFRAYCPYSNRSKYSLRVAGARQLFDFLEEHLGKTFDISITAQPLEK